MLRVENGRLGAALVKGIQDCDGQQCVPVVECTGDTFQAGAPGDWLWIEDEKDRLVPWSWQESPGDIGP
jgi:hypothetical protein